MLKLLAAFIVFISFVCAEDTVEIYATSMDSHNNIVNAYGEVVVIYKDYVLSSKEAVYNKDSGELELFGSIRATQGLSHKLLGERAKLNIATKERIFQPFYMLENKSQVWMSGDEAKSQDKDLEVTSGVLSGCNPNDPLWTMEFSSSTYNTEDKWMSIYNARIYIYDIAVLYTPYFGYSLDTTRRTGLLVPAMGLSSDEGFYYEQPLYIAEQNWWDLELKPQIRTNRGYGSYANFRFVDSQISHGEFSAGYFKEKQRYYFLKELAHDSHYGFRLNYDNNDFLDQWLGTSLVGQSGLYIDANNMNDVDYLNLSTNDTTKNATSTQILSRVNMFYNSENDYIGTYFKYYKNLDAVSNELTLQKLPTLQYHHYLETLFDNHFLYNFNLQTNNIQREKDKKVLQTNLDIPLTLQTSLFDEYLNLSYTAQMYGQHSSFSGDENLSSGLYRDGVYARNYNIFQASSQLSKSYDTFSHVAGLGATFVLNGSQIKTGFYEDTQDFCTREENKNIKQCEFYNLSTVEDALQFDFTQYFFDASAGQKIYHRLAQSVSYENIENKLGELENELDYQITESINFYHNIFYNYYEDSFSKIFNKISYHDSRFDIALSHLYKDTFIDYDETGKPINPYTSYITSSASYTYDSHYSYHVRLDYDMQTALKKSSEIGFMYQKRCWDFGLRYVENNRPILTKTESASVYDRYLYFTIVLKPFMASERGSSNFATKLPENLQGF